MSIYGSGFIGRDKSLTLGFTDDVLDGAFFVEYKKGKKYGYSKGRLLIKALGYRFENSNDIFGYPISNKHSSKYQKQIKLWVRRLYQHYYPETNESTK